MCGPSENSSSSTGARSAWSRLAVMRHCSFNFQPPASDRLTGVKLRLSASTGDDLTLSTRAPRSSWKPSQVWRATPNRP